MKKNLITAILGFLMVLPFSNCFGQNIIAGIVSSNDIYYDIIPDTSFKAQCVHLSGYPGGVYYIDIDNNGSFDFKISASGGGGLGGASAGCAIYPLDLNATIASHNDTSIGCCPTQYIVQLADTIVVGDTISNLLNFFPGKSYLWCEANGWASAPMIFDWNNIGEHYIGVKLTFPNDTLFGWIRVEATSTSTGTGGLFTITIKDFACNKSKNYSIKDINNSNSWRVYPNPATEKLLLEFPQTLKESTLIITTVSGQELIQQQINDCKSQIDIRNLTSGIYLVKLISDKTVDVIKIIKQ